MKGKTLGETYLLQWEKMPNRSLICYGHDQHNRLNVVRVANASNTKTFASANIVYHADKPGKNPNYDIHTSDGRVLNYRFEILSDFPLLVSANTPAYPKEFISYHKVKDGTGTWGYLLGHRNISCNRHYNVDYYWEGRHHVGGQDLKIKTNDPKWLRVKTLSAPVGHDHTSHVTHTFTYNTDSRVTYMREIDQTLTEYRYSPNFRMEHILRYGERDQLHHSEKYVWGEGGSLATNLLCHTFLDHQNTPLFSKKFLYDNRGNVIEERLYGNISGRSGVALCVSREGIPQDNGVETYIIKRSYSQDGLNLLLREEEQNGKVTLNNYLSGSSLLTSQFICDHHAIKIRHFYEYNGDGLLVKEIIDDGTSSDRCNLFDVRTRLIKELDLIPDGQTYQGMPRAITEKYWDGSTEKLLKKTLLTYTTGGYLAKQDIYDAQDIYCYSLTAKYDLAGRILEETNPLGQTAFYAYDSVGNQTLHKEFSNKKENHKEYDFSNRLTRMSEVGIDGVKHITTHRYDGRHNRIATQDSYGNETRFDPDAFCQIVKIRRPSIISPNGSALFPVEQHNYDSLGRESRSVNPRGYETYRRFNARNQVISTEYPDEGHEHFIYNLDGTLASYTNQEGSNTTYTYDFLGRMTSETDALGNVTTYTYSAFNLLSIKNAEDSLTSYTYDGAGRKIQEELAGEITEYFYDDLGRVYCTKKGSACHIISYDFLDRVIEERHEDTDQNVYKQISYAYDEAGNKSSVVSYIDGKEAYEHFKYDSFNRLIEYKDALGYTTTTRYDEEHQNTQKQTVLRTIVVDPLGLEAITIYDAYGQISSVEKRKAGKILDSEEFFYDENGNLAFHLKNQLHKTAWKYDPMDHPATLLEGDSKATHYTYTKTGHLLQKCKPDGTLITNSYDPIGLLKEMSSSDFSIKYTFSYNKIGQLIEEKNELDGTKTIRCLDPQGRIIKERLASGLSLISDYDEQGRKKRLTLPDQSEVFFDYDPIFLRKVIRNQKNHDFTHYDLSGHLLEQTFMGSLGSMKISYDLNRRKQAQSSSFNKQEATFDPVGNLSELITNNHLKTYGYDDLYRLTQEEGYEYKYDSHGNRIYKNHEEFQYNDLNELSSHQVTDLNGNPSKDGETRYIYDALDRLTSIQNPQETVQFMYDYQGRLLAKTTNNNPIFFIYDGFKEIGTTDASGNLLELRVLNPTSPSERGAAVLLEFNHKPYIPLHDLFGNVIALFDLEGHPIETYHHSAFGEGIQQTLNPWIYASKRLFSSNEGLVFFGKRFYNPKYGRWLTPDPAGFLDECNLYSFVANNPLTNFDHYGLFTLPMSGPTLSLISPTEQIAPHPAIEDGKIEESSSLNSANFKIPSSFSQMIHSANSLASICTNKGFTGSHAFEMGSFDLSNGAIGFMNGINNEKEQALISTAQVGKYAQGTKVHSIYNSTNSTFIDILECGLGKLGFCSPPSRLLQKQWGDFVATYPPEAKFLQICHSGAATHVQNALESSSESVRQRIIVLAIAPSVIIPKKLCYAADNYISRRDFVTHLDIFGRIKYGSELHVLDPHPNAKLWDHEFLSPTFHPILKDQVQNHINNYGWKK
ncbi:MAG: hypothetical protein LVR00_00220 [Rhabdochlamydiaceae bacterium]